MTLLMLLDSQAHYRKGSVSAPPTTRESKESKAELMDMPLGIEVVKSESVTTKIKVGVFRPQGFSVPVEQQISISTSHKSVATILIPESENIKVRVIPELHSPVFVKAKVEILKEEAISASVSGESGIDIGPIYEAHKLGKICKVKKLNDLREN